MAVDVEHMQHRLTKTYSKILHQEVLVLEKRREAQKLRMKQVDRTCAERTQTKLNGWRNLYAIQKSKDVKHRHSDQNYHCRIYSRIDDDVWQRGELRGWYQQYSRPLPRDSVDNVKSGYSLYSSTLGLSHSASAPTLGSQLGHSLGKSGGPKKGPRGAAEPHFLDFEANLTHQKGVAQAALDSKHGFPPEPIGVPRITGFRQAPWKDRPLG